VQLLDLLRISDKLRIESKQLPTVLIRSSSSARGGSLRDELQELANAGQEYRMKLVVDDVDNWTLSGVMNMGRTRRMMTWMSPSNWNRNCRLLTNPFCSKYRPSSLG
jgi:hypothetical protein